MALLMICVLSCVLDHVAPFLIRSVSSHLFKLRRYDCELREELGNLNQELSGLSMVNEFAKYAKLQRKCNKLKDILMDNSTQRRNWLIKLQLSLIYAFYIMNAILILSLSYFYKNVPVIILPEDTLWPIHDILSWPCQHKNAISLITWIIITRLGISTYKKVHG